MIFDLSTTFYICRASWKVCTKRGRASRIATYRNPRLQGQTSRGPYSLALKAAELSSTTGIAGPKPVFEAFLRFNRMIAALNLIPSRGILWMLKG
jgi:hypothetical protein